MGLPTGMIGTLKLIAALALVAIALLALGWVLDVVPRESFNALAGKVLLVAGIALAVGVAMALLMRGSGDQR